MDPAAVDELIEWGDRESRTVSIPKLHSAAPQDINSNGTKKRPPLKREMSERALRNELPPDVQGDRRFFRNWVRAVKV